MLELANHAGNVSYGDRRTPFRDRVAGHCGIAAPGAYPEITDAIQARKTGGKG